MKKEGYAGRIQNAGSQKVEAPMQKTQKGKTVKTIGKKDLRDGK